MSTLTLDETSARAATNMPELLECLRKIGKGLIASGSSVGVVENTLTKIALAYQVECEIVALPTVLMLKLGESVNELTDFAVQRTTSLPLNQFSALLETIDDVTLKRISPSEASQRVDDIRTLGPRFGPAIVVLGYVVSIIGLTLRFRPDLQALAVTASAGLFVALLVLAFSRWPRFNLLLPVVASMLVSAVIFNLTQEGWVYGAANLIIAPLITFLPGAILTTGMIELASMNLISGSSRLMYGAASLFLLFIGIAVGLNLSNLPHTMVSSYEASWFPWWAPILGTLLFGVGTFVRLSGSNRDLLWMLLVLYIAMVGQTIGEALFNPYFGAFLGATFMALSSEIIARSPRRTPALVSQALAFWFLVPGARGLLSVTSILSQDYQTALIGLGQMIVLITAIALGVFLGSLIIAPDKFIPVTTQPAKLPVKPISR
jgi:uncharacterized membrane protein YjjP (DUF1212 family)/uncharacterized membrane protein YjjB (DUF3815 family)